MMEETLFPRLSEIKYSPKSKCECHDKRIHLNSINEITSAPAHLIVILSHYRFFKQPVYVISPLSACTEGMLSILYYNRLMKAG